MASSSVVDAATEALIAQLMAEDLGELYHRHSAPIGASYHDYEDPLTSYERQCLDAGEDPDEEGWEASGWGSEVPEKATTDDSLCSNMPASEGTWDSSFVDEDGQIQKHTAPEHSPQAVEADDDDEHCVTNSCSTPENKELSSSPTRIVSLPADNVATNPAGEERNISAPMTLPTQPNSKVWPGPIRVPADHLDSDRRFSHSESSIPSNHLTRNERLPASREWEAGGQWDDDLDYSSCKGKGKAVRAYDEFKRGLRDGEKDRWDPNAADPEHEEEEDTDHDSEDEGEIRGENHPFLRIPWPSIEHDELLSRREDSEVVEIHVGDDETLESILRDISLRDERRRKGKCVEGSIEDHPSTRQKDVTAWW